MPNSGRVRGRSHKDQDAPLRSSRPTRRRHRRRRHAGERWPRFDCPGGSPRPLRDRPRPRLLGVDPPGQGQPRSLRRCARGDRQPGRRDLGGSRRRRHDGEHRPVRGEGDRHPGLRRPAPPRQSGDRRHVRRLPPDCRRGVPEGARPEAHREDRRRYQLRRGDGAGRDTPAGRCRPTGGHPVHRRQARRQGRPVSEVQPTRDRLFGNRTPFALLPVGMGLDPKDRGPLEAGLQKMQILRDMPPCVSGATFEWPQSCSRPPSRRATRSPWRSRMRAARSPSPPRRRPSRRRRQRSPWCRRSWQRPAMARSPLHGHPSRQPRTPRRSPTTRSNVTLAMPRRSSRPRACPSSGPRSSRASPTAVRTSARSQSSAARPSDRGRPRIPSPSPSVRHPRPGSRRSPH